MAEKETNVTSVTLTDGRTVDFAGKRQMIKRGDVEKGTVTFDFINGETRTFDIPESLLMRCAVHGASQKIGDDVAGVKEVDDMVTAVDAMIERLNKGEWGATREAGDSFAGASIVIRAICEVTGKSVEEVKAFLEGKIEASKDAEGKATLTRQKLYASFRNPTSKTGIVIARMEQEKAAKSGGANADDLLSELG